jgi:hypothetical protein
MDTTTNESIIPDNFRSSIIDFINDLSTTFPEYTNLLIKWTNPDCDLNELFEHCSKVYPERFFDILNQNTAIFEKDSQINTEFLPNIDFKLLYNCEGISERTKETIWKYLQVIMLTLVNSIKDKMNFGETLNMFDNLEEGDLSTKLQDAISNIGNFFDKMNDNVNDQPSSTDDTPLNENPEPNSSSTAPGLPKMEELHGHLQGLFDGKIGQLAKELAEEMSADITESFGKDMEGMTSTKDVLSKLMQNPQKIQNVVKTVKDKLSSKMDSGDISREDLMSEASEMMKKMNGLGGEGGLADIFKNMGGEGGGDMNEMFKNMAKTMGVNLPSGAKLDTNAIANVQKKATLKERLISRAQVKKTNAMIKDIEEKALIEKRKVDYDIFIKQNPNIFDTDCPNSLVYRLDGEQQEKSISKPDGEMTASKKKRMKQRAKKEAQKNAI